MSSLVSAISDAATSLLGGGGAAPPSVRKPVVEVVFGGPAPDAGGGGVLGALGSVADSLLGGGSSNDPYASAAVELRADLGLAPQVDVVEVLFSAGRGPKAAVGDEASVKLGYADSTTVAVFKGKVAGQRTGSDGSRRLVLHNASADLAALRLNVSFESQSAGDVVGHIAAEASVPKGRIESGPDLAFYGVDDRMPAYAHIAELAEMAGLVARVNGEGKLDWLPIDDGSSVQTFTWGQDVMSGSLRSAAAATGKRTVVGEGAAGSSGSDAWCWLVKDPSSVKASVGDGPGERVLARPALRSRDAVSKASAGVAAGRARAAALLQLVVPGAPAVASASVFEVAGAPDAGMNAKWAAVRVRHRMSKTSGFVSIIDAIKAGAGAGAGGGGLLDAIGGLL